MAKYVVARVADVPDGDHIVVDVNGRSVGVFNVGGEFYGLLNHCPHQGGPMCEGLIVGLLEADEPGKVRFDPDHRFLVCPWHGWEFDIKTGQSYFDPSRTRLRKFPVAVESGDVLASELTDGLGATQLAKGPYMAETVEVIVEDDYVVLRMRDKQPHAAPDQPPR